MDIHLKLEEFELMPAGHYIGMLDLVAVISLSDTDDADDWSVYDWMTPALPHAPSRSITDLALKHAFWRELLVILVEHERAQSFIDYVRDTIADRGDTDAVTIDPHAEHRLDAGSQL